MEQQPLELLAPAKNSELGMAAISHGADAVYIGAEQFGARAAAGNSIAEIERLCAYAHRYRARVYVALNTLIFDRELEAARDLVCRIRDAGADALIVQDMGLLEMDLPPIPLFASTQTDNRTPEKVRFLEQSGFERVILARELGLDAIREIRKATRVDLEAFVHGALCVCYSGQCYMSAAIGGRSANRGACGQPCRLPWNLVTGRGEVLAENRYLLSLKDMNRADHLAALAGAGITSFKIEGRLKDLAYVKNVTGFYRRRLDALLEGNQGYVKASSGKTVLSFTPDPVKTFNRGETDYFLLGREGGPVHSPDTPKSRGEKIGIVKKVTPDWLTLKTRIELHNGDGLCFLDAKGRLKGFLINRVDKAGKLFPPGRQPLKKMPISPGTLVYRNHDQAFSRLMAGKTSERRIGLDLVFSEISDGFILSAEDEDNTRVEVMMKSPKEPARNEERALGVIETQLGKLGNTLFFLRTFSIESAPYFLSAKALNRLRRDLVSALEEEREKQFVPMAGLLRTAPAPYPESDLDFRANVANALARKFYGKRGVTSVESAFELSPADPGGPVMTTKHCIRYSMGQCPKYHKSKESAWSGPLYLENEKGRFQVIIDCKRCEMTIIR
jgi:putative protease